MKLATAERLDYVLPALLEPLPDYTERRARPSQGPRGRYFATLAEHGIRFKSPGDDELRYWFNGLVFGQPRKAKPTKLWTPQLWQDWKERFAWHCEACPGGDACTLLRRAEALLADPAEAVQCR